MKEDLYVGIHWGKYINNRPVGKNTERILSLTNISWRIQTILWDIVTDKWGQTIELKLRILITRLRTNCNCRDLLLWTSNISLLTFNYLQRFHTCFVRLHYIFTKVNRMNHNFLFILPIMLTSKHYSVQFTIFSCNCSYML